MTLRTSYPGLRGMWPEFRDGMGALPSRIARESSTAIPDDGERAVLPCRFQESMRGPRRRATTKCRPSKDQVATPLSKSQYLRGAKAIVATMSPITASGLPGRRPLNIGLSRARRWLTNWEPELTDRAGRIAPAQPPNDWEKVNPDRRIQR